MALGAFIPLLAVVKSSLKGLSYTESSKITFEVTVYEDDQGALILANLDPGRHITGSKFYNIRLHLFRSWMKPNNIGIAFVPSESQKADFLTKLLSSKLFQANRALSMGWQ